MTERELDTLNCWRCSGTPQHHTESLDDTGKAIR